MDIMNRDRNVFNSVCEIVYLSNINSRLAVLIDRSCSTGDLEAKVCSMGQIHWIILVSK